MDNYVSRKDAVAEIKAAFKRRGLRYSVTHGRGTASGWLKIDLLPSVLKTLDEAGLKAAYTKLGQDLGVDYHRSNYGVSIAANSDYYREYIDRANGRKPSVIGQPYWD